jgi:parallel beta-helix repeat protein
MHSGRGTGIMVNNANKVTVDSNNIFDLHTGGVTMVKSDDTTISNNYISLHTRYWSGTVKLDEIAGILACNKDQNCKRLKIQNNIVGGFHMFCYVIPTTPCSDSKSITGNIAHSCNHGVHVLHNNDLGLDTCQLFNGFKVHKTREQGVLTYQKYNVLKVQNIETYDCGRGITLNNGGVLDNYKTKIEATNITMWGSNNLLLDKGGSCIDTYGMWLSHSSYLFKAFTAPTCYQPYDHIFSNGNFYTEIELNNVQFKNWATKTQY